MVPEYGAAHLFSQGHSYSPPSCLGASHLQPLEHLELREYYTHIMGCSC